MTKVNPNNVNKTKSYIFPRGKYSNLTSFFIKTNDQSISMTFKITISEFYD